MAKTLRIMSKSALRQKGWWLFAAIITLQAMVVVTSYFLHSS